MSEPRRKQFPAWLKKPWPLQPDMRTQRVLQGLQLNTVCRSAECPNQGECWLHGTAAFLILGDCCTRACRFCAVRTGAGAPLEVLAEEPARVAQAAKQLGLKHAVVTSVTRDDLPDEGAGHFARVIQALREACGPQTTIEVLVPDFHAREDCIRAVLAARPDVFNHNLETVERLYGPVRPQGDYRRALKVLETARRVEPSLTTKSGLMAGLGETQDEVRGAIRDLRGVGCDILTIGQYLRPSAAHLPVAEYVPLDVFESYEQYALGLGFRAAACGPFVRSSYHAEAVLHDARPR
ncbi:MAG: lipoyl synthase [Planctomycetota bacterium]|nr:lipoyl synthase [Planctomycetota bacterium]